MKCHAFQRSSIIADLIQVHRGAKGRAIVFTETKQEASELAMSGLKSVGVLKQAAATIMLA